MERKPIWIDRGVGIAAFATIVGCVALPDTADRSRATVLAPVGKPVVARIQTPAGPANIRVAYIDPPVGPPSDEARIAWLLGIGTASLPLGFVAPPMFAGAFVVGGAIDLLGGAVMYGGDSHALAVMRAAIAEADLPRAVVAGLVRRLGAAGGDASVADVAINLRGVGLVPYGNDRFCFVLGSETTVALRGRPPEPVDLRIESVPSRDPLLPPPQCATRERFVRDDGRLIRDTARDYAEVLAAVVSRRLQTAP